MSNKDKDTKQEEYNKDYEYAMAHPQVGIECKKHSCFYHPLLGCHYCGKYAGMNYYQFKDTKECCKKCKDKLGGSPELGYVPQCLLFGNCSCHKPFEAQEEKAEVEEPCCPHGNTTNNCPICEPHTSTGCSCDKCLPQSSDWKVKLKKIKECGVGGVECYTDWDKVENLISSELSIAKKEVLNSLYKEVEEKKKVHKLKHFGDSMGYFNVQGYNEAIRDILSLIDQYKNGKSN